MELSSEGLKSFEILSPPLQEQNSIVTFLDTKTAKIDHLIHLKERKIELLKEKRIALINHVVTKGLDPDVEMKDSGIEWIGEIPVHWNRTALKRIVETKITDGPHETPVFVDTGIPFVSAEGVRNGIVDFDFKRGNISREVHELYSKKCKPEKGDVFVVKSGSTTGKVAYVDTEIEFNIWSPIALIRPKEEFNNKYVFYFLGSECFQKQVQLSWSFGTQPNIGMGVLENLVISYPIIKEQNAIVEYLEHHTSEIDSLIKLEQNKIDLLKEYRQSLISEVVTGKIRVYEEDHSVLANETHTV